MNTSLPVESILGEEAFDKQLSIAMALVLPTGERPGWELETEDTSRLKSISKSSVILHSLRQSRLKWLSLFTKFSSRGRGGKSSDILPPPHTIQTRGKCDLEIGPHIYASTVFYEVHYLPPPPPSVQRPTYMYQPQSSSSSWQSTTAYGASYAPYAHHPPTVSTPSTTYPPSQASTTITPSLINQVNSAASTNPTLSNLLQLAASGNASPDQLKTLGLLIQSLAATQVASAPSTSSSALPLDTVISATQASSSSISTVASTANHSDSHTPLPMPMKPFDLVIEFSETPHERWIFPRGPVVCERVPDSQSPDVAYDILLRTSILVNGEPKAAAASAESSTGDYSSQVVNMRLHHAPLSVWDTMVRWVGGEEKIEQNRRMLQQMRTTKRKYLAHQLPEGSLLTQIQNAAAPAFNMKFIKPGQAPVAKPRRKAIPRKVADDARKMSDVAKPQIDAAETSAKKVQVPKRRRVSQAKKIPPLTQISCFTCGQTDVPLILGGRFCRPCVESGKAAPHLQQQTYKYYVPPGVHVDTARSQTQINGNIVPGAQTVVTAVKPTIDSTSQPSQPPTTQS